ncbi:Gfo/Idh/MocA family protein [Shimia sp.]|uniref:Gfo/Idh/MocA family protein n=1 Tax=Shimia sp. TaxID=1954381 RepID=UPI003B8CD653
MSLAVIGAGLIGRKHAQLAADIGVLSAIVDPNPETRSFAQALGCAYFETPEACLDTGTLEGVIVATPNHLHIAHARLCVQNKLPVLIEKPISDVSATAASLVAEATKASVPLLVAHHRRHNPISQRAAQCVADGDLGDIRAVSGHFMLFKPDDYFDQNWRRNSGAGPIFINLIHDVDLLRFIVGEIRAVQAVQSSTARGYAVEETASIILEFENGALGTFMVSDAVSAPWSWEFTAGENPAYPLVDADAYRISGSHGSLSVPDLRLWKHPQKRSWWEPIASTKLHVDPKDPLAAQLHHFLDVCQGAQPLVRGIDGLRSLEVVEAIKKAALTKLRVQLF